MNALDQLAERQIEHHLQRVDPAANPFAGRALDLEADAHVPSELRALYRVLAHQGLAPPELALWGEINNVWRLLQAATDDAQRGAAARRLQALQAQLEARGAAVTPQQRLSCPNADPRETVWD